LERVETKEASPGDLAALFLLLINQIFTEDYVYKEKITAHTAAEGIYETLKYIG